MTPTDLLTHFDPDPDRLALVRECTERYDVGDPTADWPNNLLSTRTVVYGSGVMARRGDPVRHAVSAAELAVCRRLAAEAEALMAGVVVGMGSEATDEFRGWFVPATAGDPVPAAITLELVRERFGGTLFPPATISVEPLAEAGVWWEEVRRDTLSLEDEAVPLGGPEEAAALAPWQRLITWFTARPAFAAAAFVRVGDARHLSRLPEADYPPGTEITGCVLPRLAVGLTPAGSLVGLFGYVVQT